jgi:hypothetical protein
LAKRKKKKDKRHLITLYDCAHARVKGACIYCDKGVSLSNDGTVNLDMAARGEPLVMPVCQQCEEFELAAEEFIKPIERGWIHGPRQIS